MTCVVVLLGVGAYFAYSAYHHVSTLLISAGCQVGSGQNTVALDTQQASIAATIAGVAADEGLPAHAVTIAYATAMQESKLHNLAYGDRDSVGVFQQRPSQGWGTKTQLQISISLALRGCHSRRLKNPAGGFAGSYLSAP